MRRLQSVIGVLCAGFMAISAAADVLVNYDFRSGQSNQLDPSDLLTGVASSTMAITGTISQTSGVEPSFTGAGADGRILLKVQDLDDAVFNTDPHGFVFTMSPPEGKYLKVTNVVIDVYSCAGGTWRTAAFIDTGSGESSMNSLAATFTSATVINLNESAPVDGAVDGDVTVRVDFCTANPAGANYGSYIDSIIVEGELLDAPPVTYDKLASYDFVSTQTNKMEVSDVATNVTASALSVDGTISQTSGTEPYIFGIGTAGRITVKNYDLDTSTTNSEHHGLAFVLTPASGNAITAGRVELQVYKAAAILGGTGTNWIAAVYADTGADEILLGEYKFAEVATGADELFDFTMNLPVTGLWNQAVSFRVDFANEDSLDGSQDGNTSLELNRIDVYGFSAPAEAPADGYSQWALGWGVNIGSETNDYDADTFNNFYEYAFNGDPTNSAVHGDGLVLESNGGSLSVVHVQRNDDTNLVYTLQTASDLLSPVWTNTGYTAIGTNVVGSYDYVTNAISTSESAMFVRLKAEK